VRLTQFQVIVYAARFTFAHRARCAAAIRLRPAAEIVLFGFAVLTVAQRAFCARLILRLPSEDIFRVPLELLPNAASASSTRWSCCRKCRCSRFSCRITADMLFMEAPAE
jgi:hypothetical protein